MIEIFESEPHVLDEEADIFKYSRTDRFGFTLSLYLSAFEESTVVTLKHRDLSQALFDHILQDVVELVCKEDDSLHFYRDSDLQPINPDLAPEPVLTVLTKPHFRIEVKTD